MTTLFISYSSKDRPWSEDVREALRGKGYQSLFLDWHPDDGIHSGSKWEQVLWQRLRQSRGVVVLCTANWLVSPWCVAEAMIARERGKPVFLLATPEVLDDRQTKGRFNTEQVPRIPDFLKDTQLISLADVTMDEAYRRLWRGLKEEGLADDFPLPGRPYPGLEPFQESDAAVFFGRQNETASVMNVLNRRWRNNARGFILVLGASGCGKSSLVRAGLLPRLRGASGNDGSTSAWLIPPPIMAGKGFEGLTVSLALAFKEAGLPLEPSLLHHKLIAERADQAMRELAIELRVARGLPDGLVLLVLDQLEEVFNTAEGSEVRAALRLLLDTTADVASTIVVLATMRSDFLNTFQLFEGAAYRYEEVTLDPMPRSRFGEVIAGPADRFGLRLDPGLSEHLIEDTAYDDALPLLAFTLEKLYEKGQANGALTMQAYRDLGGVSAAIRYTADEILADAGYASLPADDPRMRDLRRAFYSLARVGEEGQLARRLARWAQMPSSSREVLDGFVKQRLLVSGAENGEPTLGVTHEALFRVWDTLHDWLTQDRKALARRARVEDAAAEWDAAGRIENRQWAEERVLDAIREIDRSGVSLEDTTRPGTVRAFLGPTEPNQLLALPSLGVAEDATCGSGRYGDAWRLPLTHEARASVGVRLASVGDPRPGIGLRADGVPDIDWCRIEHGAVTIEIRSNADDPNSDAIERLTRFVDPFWMARYPVTVAQFEAFVGHCHEDGTWRLPPGFPVELLARYPPPKPKARHGNHPADSVNWWDAASFCHWLGARLGFEVRLPTEYEWQLAATGGDIARIYTWGPEWDTAQEPWRANTFESNLGGSTAVGMYPAGASPAGILDMAGTLWEWCRFEDPDSPATSWSSGLLSKRPSEEDRIVLRGGSWGNNRDYARLAYRNRYYPFNRFLSFGFRVVCSSPRSTANQ